MDRDGPHVLVSPCRRVLGEWLDAETGRQIQVHPHPGGPGIRLRESAFFGARASSTPAGLLFGQEALHCLSLGLVGKLERARAEGRHSDGGPVMLSISRF